MSRNRYASNVDVSISFLMIEKVNNRLSHIRINKPLAKDFRTKLVCALGAGFRWFGTMQEEGSARTETQTAEYQY